MTVIVQCRNDDYGGHMLLRLNRMLATTGRMLHTTGVPSEIIIVEAELQEGTQKVDGWRAKMAIWNRIIIGSFQNIWYDRRQKDQN